MEYIVGAYASAPSLLNGSIEQESEFYKILLEKIPNVKGLEIPFFGENLHQFGNEFLIKRLNKDWSNIVTAVPASFYALQKDKHFGLASDNDEGRFRAIENLKKLIDIIKMVNDHQGKNSIMAVQLCSAPSTPKSDVSSSKVSFQKSLEELILLDWDGANLIVEHCDNSRGKSDYQKGFLSIEDELDVVKSLKSDCISMSLNWGRSVLEGKSTDTIINHITLLQEYNLLKGFIFSGTCSEDINYGSWGDQHMPFQGKSDSPNYQENSLLTNENVTESLRILQNHSLDFVGIKLQPLSRQEVGIRERASVNVDAIRIMEDSLDEIKIIKVNDRK